MCDFVHSERFQKDILQIFFFFIFYTVKLHFSIKVKTLQRLPVIISHFTVTQ